MGWLVLCSIVGGVVGFSAWRVSRREARASHEYWNPTESVSLDRARTPRDIGLGGIGGGGGGGDGGSSG